MAELSAEQAAAHSESARFCACFRSAIFRPTHFFSGWESWRSSISPFSVDTRAEMLSHETHQMTRKEEKAELIYKDESYNIIGACFAVYKGKGRGFLEPVYHECLEIELEFQRIPFLSKRPQTLQYRGRTLVQTFSPDFICYNKIVLEIKAVCELIDEHRAQLLNYLGATGCGLGLL